MSYSDYSINGTNVVNNLKRQFHQIDKPFPTFRPPTNKRPRRTLTPNSVISNLTDNDSTSLSPPSPSIPYPLPPLPKLPYRPSSNPLSPVSPTLTPLQIALPSPHFSNLRTEEDIQADISNSFAAPNSPTASWTNDLLIHVLANEVEDLIYSNDERSEDDDVGEFQTFYSSFKQPFELDFYMRRLVQYVNCSTAVFVTMFVYLDRVQERCKALLASDMNCHRLVFTCLVLAVKYLEDEVHSNGYYARVGGLTIDEMNSLELKLLKVLDWDVSVSPETFAVYEEGMMQTAALLSGGNMNDNTYQVSNIGSDNAHQIDGEDA